jgi:hypothetical protein
MSFDITSDVTSVQYLDNIGFQFVFTGTATGTFYIEVSADHVQDAQGVVTNAGNWTPLSLNPVPIATGENGTIYIDINQLSAPYIRATYEAVLEAGTITTVADVAGSLNDTYFLINGADEIEYYVWFNVNSAGTDPVLPDKTGVEVALATGATANTVAAAVEVELELLPSFDDVTVADDVVSFNQAELGPGLLEDGAVPTGFTFSYQEEAGTLNAYITAKMI